MATQSPNGWRAVGGFTLDEKDGRFKLTLHEHDRVIRLEPCAEEHEARDKAHVWLISVLDEAIII